MKITRTEVFALGDPVPSEPVDERIDELAFLRIHTDEGISGLAEIFSVPAGVARVVLDGPDSFFGRWLIGEDPIPPERLRARLYNGMLHGNRRGWAVICIGAVEVALWDITGKALGRPVYELLGGAERSLYQIHSEAQGREVVPYGTVVASEPYDDDPHWQEVPDRTLLTASRAGVLLTPVEDPASVPSKEPCT